MHQKSRTLLSEMVLKETKYACFYLLILIRNYVRQGILTYKWHLILILLSRCSCGRYYLMLFFAYLLFQRVRWVWKGSIDPSENRQNWTLWSRQWCKWKKKFPNYCVTIFLNEISKFTVCDLARYVTGVCHPSHNVWEVHVFSFGNVWKTHADSTIK